MKSLSVGKGIGFDDYFKIEGAMMKQDVLDLPKIPVAGPWITDKEIDYVTDAVKNAWYDNANVYHERFEAAFSQYVGRKYAIALSSCTSALHLALVALGVGSGDEVIVPDITWIATSAPISYVGATPVFADIDPASWCLSAESFQACITERTKAVILVDLYGNMPDMDAILKLANYHGIAVIEDSAEAIGSEHKKQKAGSFGDISTFSFHGSKTLTTGEGGMLLTDRRDIFERCLFLRDHGRAPGDKMFWNNEVAFKYKMSSLQAALGLAQIERVDELIERKLNTFTEYERWLGNTPGITLNEKSPDIKNTCWMVTALIDAGYGMEKELVIPKLKEKGIDARPFFYPLSSLPAYAGSDSAKQAAHRNIHAYAISPWGINLPSHLNLTPEAVQKVSKTLKSLLKID